MNGREQPLLSPKLAFALSLVLSLARTSLAIEPLSTGFVRSPVLAAGDPIPPSQEPTVFVSCREGTLRLQSGDGSCPAQGFLISRNFLEAGILEDLDRCVRQAVPNIPEAQGNSRVDLIHYGIVQPRNVAGSELLSLHHAARAIDVHAIQVAGHRFDYEQDFKKRRETPNWLSFWAPFTTCLRARELAPPSAMAGLEKYYVIEALSETDSVQKSLSRRLSEWIGARKPGALDSHEKQQKIDEWILSVRSYLEDNLPAQLATHVLFETSWKHLLLTEFEIEGLDADLTGILQSTKIPLHRDHTHVSLPSNAEMPLDDRYARGRLGL